MSKETLQWLNQNTLIGFTDRRGKAWHYRASDQGDEPNHYPGAIPPSDVKRRLFHWAAVEGTVETTYLSADGVTRITDDDRKTIIRPDTGKILGVFKSGYQIHDYQEWLVTNVETILDDTLSIGSAGLLKGGAVAWVQVEVPDTCTTPEGIEFRPFLSAATALDGSLASTYHNGAQVVVCDNTLSAALNERNARQVKIKHSRNSLGRITEVREALGIIHQTAETFAEEVADLTRTTVTDAQWRAFLDAHTPVPDKPGRGRTLADNQRQELNRLYRYDNRVAPWKGTAWGVISAVNTYTHHVGIVRGAERAERNLLRVVTGGVDKLDTDTLSTLNKVLANA